MSHLRAWRAFQARAGGDIQRPLRSAPSHELPARVELGIRRPAAELLHPLADRLVREDVKVPVRTDGRTEVTVRGHPEARPRISGAGGAAAEARPNSAPIFWRASTTFLLKPHLGASGEPEGRHESGKSETGSAPPGEHRTRE